MNGKNSRPKPPIGATDSEKTRQMIDALARLLARRWTAEREETPATQAPEDDATQSPHTSPRPYFPTDPTYAAS